MHLCRNKLGQEILDPLAYLLKIFPISYNLPFQFFLFEKWCFVPYMKRNCKNKYNEINIISILI